MERAGRAQAAQVEHGGKKVKFPKPKNRGGYPRKNDQRACRAHGARMERADRAQAAQVEHAGVILKTKTIPGAEPVLIISTRLGARLRRQRYSSDDVILHTPIFV